MNDVSDQKPDVEKEGLMKETGYRYKIIRKIGHGAYGSAFLAEYEGRSYALKRSKNIFCSVANAKRILRELRILQHLQLEDANIIRLFDITANLDYSDFNEVVIISDFMEANLSEILLANNTLTLMHRQLFIYQILRGLKYMHSANIVHQDLKPENILVNTNCEVRICDFGLSKVIDQNEKTNVQLAQYITTRSYRAPELLLSYDNYGPAIDMWSLGCIMAQLLLFKPLFLANSPMEQLIQIVSLLGSPTNEDLSGCTNQNSLDFMSSIPVQNQAMFKKAFPTASSEEIDLLSKMLCWDPEKRITADQALKHPFVAVFHCENFEPTSQPLDISDFEREDITLEEIKKLLWADILKFRQKFSSAQ